MGLFGLFETIFDNKEFIVDTFFGGAERKAGESEAQAIERAGEYSLTGSRETRDMLMSMYDTTRSDLAPQRQTGYEALARMSHLLGLPGYMPSEVGGGERQQSPGDSYLDRYPDVAANETFAQNPRLHYDRRGRSAGRTWDSPGGGGNSLTRVEAPGSVSEMFEETPGYQFVQDETMRAVNTRNAATGSFYSGKPMRELARYSAGLASNEFGNYFNRLSTVAGYGNQANQTTAQAGASASGASGNAMLQGYDTYANALYGAGRSRASGVVGGANATKSTFMDIGKMIAGGV